LLLLCLSLSETSQYFFQIQKGMKNLSYEEHLRKLELPTLSYRQLRGDMIEVYKIIQGNYDPEASTIIKLMNDTEQRFSLALCTGIFLDHQPVQCFNSFQLGHIC
jgi:hypothetical protein